MENYEGFLCCLGQISKQIQPELELLGYDCPTTALAGPPLVISAAGDEGLRPSLFAREAAEINDCGELTDIQRERKLERLADTYGLRIDFVGEYIVPGWGGRLHS
ncbi:hypothetical protein SAMN05421753_102325 [Planctomicrobium piriforme]|uniref:Uncharacterized protein n=2 Tax=Planctomicrobium piriforme TaxID=1576369 RepID=A0A1I3CKM1_9PLAN|nr:hypothetical protein SAMN05421753_102325 [Planctomicrobium piriforme]